MEVWQGRSFRVLLDFTEINVSEVKLKYVWMFVSPRELKTIFDLKSSIVKKFSLSSGNFNLFVRDGLLLESEKIDVLREDDTVKLQYEENQSFDICSFKTCLQMTVTQQKNDNQDSKSSGASKDSKKRKSDVSTSFVSEDGHSSKHRKKKKPDKISSLNSIEDATESQIVAVVPDKNISSSSKRKYSKQNSDDCNISFSKNVSIEKQIQDSTYTVNLSNSKNLIDTSASSNQTEASSKLAVDISSGTDSKKRKRKRKRRRKDKSKIETNSLPEVPFQTETSYYNSDKGSITNYDESSDVRKHIIYRSPSPTNDFDTITLDSNGYISQNELKEADVSLNSTIDPPVSALDSCIQKYLEEESNLNTISENKCESILTKSIVSPKISTPFSKSSLKSQSWSVTPLHKIKNQNEEEKTSTVYETCVPLTSLPPVGTRLIFKTLELNENYCPEVTEYKEGILKKVDSNTDELEIELLQEEIKPGRTGKFENLPADAIVPPQVIKTVTVNWSSLIEPRLIS